MESAPEAGVSAWWLLANGAACLALGLYLLARPGWLDAVHKATGSPPASRRERRAIPLLLAASGAFWVLAWTAEVFPYPHGSRPMWAAFAAWFLLPAGAAVITGVLVWTLVFRRITAGAPPAPS